MEKLLNDVLGGVLASAVYAVITYSYIFYKNNFFRRALFGSRLHLDNQVVCIVYGQFDINRAYLINPKERFIYIKAPSSVLPIPPMGISISAPISKCEVRAASYLSSTIARLTNVPPTLISDIDAEKNVDAHVISLGATTNYKTIDLVAALDTRRKQLYDDFMEHQRIPGVVLSPEFEYGVIVRSKSDEPAGKSKVICAGLGEWGSSGAGKYLSENWKRIGSEICGWRAHSPFTEIPDFFAFVRVRPGDDASTQLIALYAVKAKHGLIKVF